MTTSRVRVHVGDCLASLRALPDEWAHCCVTSPPYWGLRDYGVDGQLGLEATPEEYVANIVAVFREVRRVLNRRGTLWLNLGDSYAGGGSGAESGSTLEGTRDAPKETRRARLAMIASRRRDNAPVPRSATRVEGLKSKDLVGIPWRVAFALQADGWWLRSDIIWAKPNPMPESVRDRPTKSHEYVFLMTKSARYDFHAAEIRESDTGSDHRRSVLVGQPSLEPSGALRSPHRGLRVAEGRNGHGRNARSVWNIATMPFAGAHFATMPLELADRCVRAGSPARGMVLDPFGGAGTTGLAAALLGRDAELCELNPRYARLAQRRITRAVGLLTRVDVVEPAAEPAT